MDKQEFKKYYYKFLGYNEIENIVCSKEREKSINGFYYPVIISIYNGKIIYSISSKYYKELREELIKNKIENKEELEIILKKYFKNKGIKISIQTMLRMSKSKKIAIDTSKVIDVSEKNKQEYFNSFENHKDIKYKQEKWDKIKKLNYINGIIEENQFASVGYISNINHNGANIIIETKEKFRNKGYGKKIVEKISKELLEEYIIPIYWVNIENEKSIKLAQSLLFKEEAIEIVVKSYSSV